LRQNKLAAQYYSQALAAAQNKPAGFDKAQAAARLATLQQLNGFCFGAMPAHPSNRVVFTLRHGAFQPESAS
jgi:hypothetical protein